MACHTYHDTVGKEVEKIMKYYEFMADIKRMQNGQTNGGQNVNHVLKRYGIYMKKITMKREK